MRIKTVCIEITTRCNLNCITCYNRSGLNTMTNELSIKDIEHIIVVCSRYGATRFLFSGGEPSLHSHFHDLLLLIDRYQQFDFGFVTNGTVHDEAWIDFLNAHDNITIQVSLDGSCEDTNKLTRREGHFERAVGFIKKLRTVTRKPLLKMVVSQKNIHDVEKYYRFAVSLGCMPEFAFIYCAGNGSESWESKALSAHQKLSVLRLVRQLNAEYGIEAYLPTCTVRCPFSVGAEAMSIAIKTSGMIQPCQNLYSDEYSIGSIFDFQEREMYERIDALIALAKRRTLKDYGCGKCILRDTCGKGCMSEAVNCFDDPLENDGNCLFRKLQFLDMYVKEQADDALQKEKLNG